MLAETRARGYACGERRDWQPPIGVLAAPVWGAQPTPVAVLAVSSPLSRRSRNAIRRALLDDLLNVAELVSNDLGAAHYPLSGDAR
jgi:DNA-binding IclR family transcriptional regulator